MNEPLAERLRPKTLDQYLSQTHLIGEKGALRQQIKRAEGGRTMESDMKI